MSRNDRYILSFLLFFQHMIEQNIKSNSAGEVTKRIELMTKLYTNGSLGRNQRKEMQLKLSGAVDAVVGVKVEIELFYNLILIFLDEISEQTREPNRLGFIHGFIEFLNGTGYINRLGNGTAKNPDMTFKQTETLFNKIKERLQ